MKIDNQPTQRFVLEAYKGPATRHLCPGCGRQREFVRYINTATHEQLADWVGRCNREVECGYHYTPKQYFQDNRIYSQPRSPPRPYCLKRLITSDMLSFSVLNDKLVKRTLGQYAGNYFVRGLGQLLTEDIANQIAARYRIGTTREGGTIFWQVDERERVRTGKILHYDDSTLKRRKDRQPAWVHSMLKLKDYQLKQCLFGQHLLATDERTGVAIVESEKSAIVCHAYLPQFIWLATGGSHGTQLNTPDTVQLLKGRPVHLFPDRGAYDKWVKKANEMKQFGLTVTISDQLEKIDCPPNWDIADSLLHHKADIMLSTGYANWGLTEAEGYPVFWDYKINS
ncbi:hypothetical protein JYG30_06260 [Fibrella sp. USSR17]